MLNIELIKEKLGSLVSPENIFYYELTDSTNTRALEYAKGLGKDAPERAVFIADGQSAGRGRRSRSFVSNSGAGIYISLLYTPKNHTDRDRITAKCAVALRQALLKSTETETKIKWVNDLYAKTPSGEYKKIAGILAEAVTDENLCITGIVIGMGINIYKNAVSEEISDIATSLEEVKSKRFQRENIISSVIRELFCERDEKEVLCEYRENSLTLRTNVIVIPHSGEEYDAFVDEILEDYTLSVKTANGEKKRVFSGEVRTKIKT